MSGHFYYVLKELIVILTISGIVFFVAKPVLLRFTASQDFIRRRNVWLCLTVAAFLSPTFWFFALIGVPLLIWAGRKDSNVVALYLLFLQVVPTVQINVPMFGINGLILIDIYRILSLCVLVPAVLRWRRASRVRAFNAIDILILGYGLIQTFLFIEPDTAGRVFLQDSPTNMLRRAVLFGIDVYVPYLVISRGCTTRRVLLDVFATFCLSCALMASLGIFETASHWLLFSDMVKLWGVDNPIATFYSVRNGLLRAQVSTGHPLSLGYILAIGFGFWLYLRTHIHQVHIRVAMMALLLAGLWVTYSRGPWIGAIVIYFTFAVTGLGASSRLIKAIASAGIVGGIVMVSPLGEQIVKLMPFMGGSVDDSSLLYRQRLFYRSLDLIREHPFFGDEFTYMHMADLRQGQGIIDFVNAYAQAALFYGLVGLSVFVGPLFLGLVRVYRQMKAIMPVDRDMSLMGASLIACMIGTLVMIGAAGFVLAYRELFYVLVGLAVAFAQLCRSKSNSVTYAQGNSKISQGGVVKTNTSVFVGAKTSLLRGGERQK